MSDYYGNPISIPPGVVPPSVASLYQAAGVGAPSAANGGMLSGLLSRVPSFAGNSTPIIEGGLRGAARAAGPAFVGQLATAGINNVLPSTGGGGNLREILGDAATGAGIGASAGMLGGPFAGISVPAGAAIGGLAGGAYGLAQDIFGGSNKTPDYKTQLATAASQLGLDPNQYSVAYDLLSKSGADPKTLSGQLAAQLLQDASIKKQTDQATAIQAQQHTSDQQYALAMQSQIQQFLSPYTNNILTDGLAQAENLKAHAANLPPAYASVLQAQAAEAVSSSQRLASAYAGQAVALPNQYMMNADLKRQTELATLRYQQAVVNAQAGKGGGGFAQALAAQTPTGG